MSQATQTGCRPATAAENLSVALVTVSGKTHFNKPYTARCIASWSKLADVSSPWYIISDGLRDEDRERAVATGFTCVDRHPEAVLAALARRPALAVFREASPTWRHVIDSVVLFHGMHRVVLIDTDVLVLQACRLPLDGPDFVFSQDDIPGYRGSPLLPLQQPILPTINPGFMVLNPAAVDLDFLEFIARRYLVHSKNYWWTRQSALSVVVANSDARAMFDGRDVRVVSANRKRSPEQVVNDRWKYLGNSQPVTDQAVVRRSMQDAAVLHLAGYGKRWIDLAMELVDESPGPRVLRVKSAPLATGLERCGIATRMFLLQVGRKRYFPVPQLAEAPAK